MFSPEVINMIILGIGQTLYMVILSTLFGYVLGLPWGITLAVTNKEGIRPNAAVYRVIDFITNIMRSIPFLILLILIIPLTKLIVGKSYGSTATIVPLVISAAPFIARMVESSLKEVDHGVIEAAQSMGASIPEIIFKVIIPEAKTSLIVGATISSGTILGYSAMSGAIGGGGLGKIAISYGYNRYQTDVLFVTVILLILLMQVIQIIGMYISRKTDKRIRE
jgi:D-methionine transport system permease protein